METAPVPAQALRGQREPALALGVPGSGPVSEDSRRAKGRDAILVRSAQMSTDPLTSPVVVDGIVSEEKLAELLALQTEYPELDYKATIDLSAKPGLIELAKDIGAMRVRGGTSSAAWTTRAR